MALESITNQPTTTITTNANGSQTQTTTRTSSTSTKKSDKKPANAPAPDPALAAAKTAVASGNPTSATTTKVTGDAAAAKDAVSTGSVAAAPAAGTDGVGESAYIRELNKHIRNVTKKLAAMQKVDSVMAENPNVSLDELVASRKINNDQKAQALKKPALKAQLAQFEEQVTQYKKFEEEYQEQAEKEKTQLQAAHQQELETVKASAKAEAKTEAEGVVRQKLLTLSRFLRAAAARRQVEDDTSEQSKAFEGLLLLLYGGDIAAVDAAEKLINGSDEGVTSTEDLPLSVSYAKIKEISEAYAPFAAEEAWRQEVADAEQNNPGDAATEPARSLETDPTVAHAGLTEINAAASTRQSEVTTSNVPGDIDTSAANDAAANSWDATGSSTQDPLAESWVSVPRDPAETENPPPNVSHTATQSWADEVPDVTEPPAAAAAAAAPAGDGFHEVHHNRSSGKPRGGERNGRGGRGGFRGDGSGHRGRGGFRGDRNGEFRGRGRGGARGTRGTA